MLGGAEGREPRAMVFVLETSRDGSANRWPPLQGTDPPAWRHAATPTKTNEVFDLFEEKTPKQTKTASNSKTKQARAEL